MAAGGWQEPRQTESETVDESAEKMKPSDIGQSEQGRSHPIQRGPLEADAENQERVTREFEHS